MNLAAVPRCEYNDAQWIAHTAVRSLYAELALHPKPGLVSLVDAGAHEDMDASTFMRSLFALRHYFADIARAGATGAAFATLKALGVAAEARMLRATGGVNTHRGAIFVLGLLAAAAGVSRARPSHGGMHLRAVIVERWSRDLRATHALASHGRWVASRYGVSGARGEALQGFPSVFELALPALRDAFAHGADEEAAKLHAFFCLLARVEDTNLLYRGGVAGLRYVQTGARAFLDQGSVFAGGWREHALELHRACGARRLSPGGCADLLAATWFVYRLEQGR